PLRADLAAARADLRARARARDVDRNPGGVAGERRDPDLSADRPRVRRLARAALVGRGVRALVAVPSVAARGPAVRLSCLDPGGADDRLGGLRPRDRASLAVDRVDRRAAADPRGSALRRDRAGHLRAGGRPPPTGWADDPRRARDPGVRQARADAA